MAKYRTKTPKKATVTFYVGRQDGTWESVSVRVTCEDEGSAFLLANSLVLEAALRLRSRLRRAGVDPVFLAPRDISVGGRVITK